MRRQTDRNKEPMVGIFQPTGTNREAPDTVEGVFASEAVAESVAKQLRAAFPDRVVTVEDGDAPHRVKVRTA